MMKKVFMAAAAATALTMTMAAGTFAAENTKVEADGIAFEIPAEFSDLVTVKMDDGDMLVSVYETASLEAAKALGETENSGAGWLFGISRLPESRVRELRCGAMDGMEVFAEDDDFYLIYNHPTDVRLVREKQEEYEAGFEQFSKLNGWAAVGVPAEILLNNAELDPESFTNTELDMYLAMAAYQPGTNFEVRSLMFRNQDLPIVDAQDHLEDLADDFIYIETDALEAPAGEYLVLAFPDDDVRFDFFSAEGYQNLVREAYTVDGEEHERLFIAAAKSDDDANDTPFEVMQDWCEDILNGDD